MFRPALIGSLLILLVCSMNSFAQETVREINREIKKVKAETKREKELHAAERKRQQEFKKSSADKLHRIKSQTSLVKAQTDSLKKELARMHEARRKLKGTANWYRKKKDAFAIQLADRVDSLVPLLEKDYPYKREESVQATREIASQLRRQVITPEEGLGRIWDLLLDRIRLGYTAETYAGYLNLDGGQSMAGKFLRYGAVWSMFVSQDGESIYYLKAGDGNYEWVSAGKDLELRRTLKEALKVAEGKTAPQLVAVPFPATLVKEKSLTEQPAPVKEEGAK